MDILKDEKTRPTCELEFDPPDLDTICDDEPDGVSKRASSSPFTEALVEKKTPADIYPDRAVELIRKLMRCFKGSTFCRLSSWRNSEKVWCLYPSQGITIGRGRIYPFEEH
jgi:hypothetical protein